eukprot:10883088-Alexandrium_andersonii.AAC.1
MVKVAPVWDGERQKGVGDKLAVILGISSQQREAIGRGGAVVVPCRPLQLRRCAWIGNGSNSGAASAKSAWEGACHACRTK